MNIYKNNKISELNSNRFLYTEIPNLTVPIQNEAPEKKEEAPKSSNRSEATERGRGDALKLIQQTQFLSGKRILELKGKTKKNNEGMLEQNFNFNVSKGKIILPENPNLDTKPTIIFNYVKNDTSFKDSEKFLQQLKNLNINLENTVIVNITTPDMTTKINGEKDIDSMLALTEGLKSLQKDYPELEKLNLSDPGVVFHMAEKQTKDRALKLIERYKELRSSMPETETNTSISPPPIFYDSTENISEKLSQAIQQMEQKETTKTGGGIVRGGGGGGFTSGSSGGGSAGEGSGGGFGGSFSGGEKENFTNENSSDTENMDSTEITENAPSESNDLLNEGIDKLLILGDSLMEGAQNHLSKNFGGAQKVECTAKKSKTLRAMLRELKSRESTLKDLNTSNCRGTILVRGGGNDLAGNADAGEVFGYMKEMAEIAKKHNLKIFFCAMTPFGGSSLPGYKNDYDAKNERRKEINEKLYEMSKSDEFKNTVGVIPLDKTISEGGMASDDRNDTLAKNLTGDPKATGFDGVHLTPDGYKQMSKIISKYLRKNESLVASENLRKNEPIVAPNLTKLAVEYRNKWFKEKRPVGHKETVEFEGKKYTFSVQAHDLQASTQKRIPSEKFQSARAHNWPIEEIGNTWFYAVEAHEQKEA